MAQTREELDEIASRGCMNPECKSQEHDLFISGRCHEGAPVRAKYAARSGVLNFYCAVCMKPVADIAVARMAEEPEALH